MRSLRMKRFQNEDALHRGGRACALAQRFHFFEQTLECHVDFDGLFWWICVEMAPQKKEKKKQLAGGPQRGAWAAGAGGVGWGFVGHRARPAGGLGGGGWRAVASAAAEASCSSQG